MCLQAELKHKLSERDKLIAEYEVWTFVVYPLVLLLRTYICLKNRIFVFLAATRQEGQDNAATAAEA